MCVSECLTPFVTVLADCHLSYIAGICRIYIAGVCREHLSHLSIYSGNLPYLGIAG